jgi:hypothetical protein
VKALVPILAVCAVLVVSDVWLTGGGNIRAANDGIMDFGKAVQRQIGKLVD